jgi:hypothetical protein
MASELISMVKTDIAMRYYETLLLPEAAGPSMATLKIREVDIMYGALQLREVQILVRRF